MSGKSKATASNLANQLPGNQHAVNGRVLPCAASRDPQLKVKVFARVKGKKVPIVGNVSASALSKASLAADGLADFSYVHPGTYDVSATAILAPHVDDYYTTALVQRVTLAPGDNKTLNVEVKPRNVITPKIELEYKVVLFDPNLVQHEIVVHDPPAAELKPQTTRIEVSLRCSESDPPYLGDGTLVAPNCTVFLDEACQRPLGARKLTNAELTANSAMKLYLRGTARGLFTATLTLDASADGRIKVEPPATEDMGVVAPQLIVHQHAAAVAVGATTYPLTGYCADLENLALIPDQVLLSDADKVQQGRLLHKQSKKHHGRAKAVLRLTAAEWPAGTDDYQIVLTCSGPGLRAYDAENDGAKQSLPLQTKVVDLKAAEKTLWIEGTSSSAALRDMRLSVGLDRASGGLSKAAKTNADWTRFTVVEIDSIKLHYTAPAAGQPKAWNAKKKLWYINYRSGDPGRRVTIRAKLSKPIAGIKLHFMLSPDQHNLQKENWGIDLPATWAWDGVDTDVKHKDKVNATDLLHKFRETDADGQADCELVLSRFGGDKFVPGVYIGQDPHLAAYVHEHPVLAERKPKLASDFIKVWRKFAYQKIKIRGRAKYPSTGVAENVYGRVRAEMLKVPSVYVDEATVGGWARPSLLPEYMFKLDGSETNMKLNVSDANQAQFFGLVAADAEHPIKVPIITCDFNWGLEDPSGIVTDFELTGPDFEQEVRTDMLACDPPMQGGALLAGGQWTVEQQNVAGMWVTVRQGPLQNGDVDINPRRKHLKDVRIKLPAGVGALTAANRVMITNLQINGAGGFFLGGYNCNRACPGMIVAVYDAADPGDYQNTVVHELGHAFSQTSDREPAAGIPRNPSYLPTPTGEHCSYNTDKCVMFTSGPIAGSLNQYCPDCHPYLLVQDMSRLA